MDYRHSKDVFPLPRMDQLLDQLSGRKVFSTLDALAGYWQIRISEGSKEQYWWKGICPDAHRFGRGCLTCAAYQGAGPSHIPPLQPISVGGPFETVGMDVLEMPPTERGSTYIIAFVDFMTKWVEAYSGTLRPGARATYVYRR